MFAGPLRVFSEHFALTRPEQLVSLYNEFLAIRCNPVFVYDWLLQSLHSLQTLDLHETGRAASVR